MRVEKRETSNIVDHATLERARAALRAQSLMAAFARGDSPGELKARSTGEFADWIDEISDLINANREAEKMGHEV